MKVYAVFTREAYEPAVLDGIFASAEAAMKRVESIKSEDIPYVGFDGEMVCHYIAVYCEELEVKN